MLTHIPTHHPHALSVFCKKNVSKGKQENLNLITENAGPFDTFCSAKTSQNTQGMRVMSWMSIIVMTMLFNTTLSAKQDSMGKIEWGPLSYEHGSYVTTIDWTHTGSFLAIGGGQALALDDNLATLRIYEFNPVTTFLSEKITATADHGNTVMSINWHPNSIYLATAGATAEKSGESASEIRVYSYNATTEALHELSGCLKAHGDTVLYLEWSPDGNYLAIGGKRITTTNPAITHRVYQFDAGAGTLTELAGCNKDHGANVDIVTWSPNGKYLAVGGYKKTHTHRIYAFDSSAKTLTDLVGCQSNHGDAVHNISWRPDGNYCAVGGSLFDSETQITHRVYSFNSTTSTLTDLPSCQENHGATVWFLEWNPTGSLLMVGGEQSPDGTNATNRIYAFDSTSTNTLTELTGTRYNMGIRSWDLGWHPVNEKYLAICGGPLSMEPFTGFQIGTFDSNAQTFNLLTTTRPSLGDATTTSTWNPANTHLAIVGTRSNNNSLYLYEFDACKTSLLELTSCRADHGASLSCAAWSHDGTYLAVGGTRNKLINNTQCSHRIYQFNSTSKTLTELPSCRADHGSDVTSLDWCLTKTQYLMIGGIRNNVIGSTYTTGRIYKFDPTMTTSLMEVTQARTDHGDHATAIKWQYTNDIVAVAGIRNNNINATNASLRLYDFNSTTSVITEQFNSRVDHGHATWALSWSCSDAYLLAGGESNNLIDATETDLRIYKYDTSLSNSLSEKTTARTDFGGTVKAVSWYRGNKTYCLVGGDRHLENNAYESHTAYYFNPLDNTLTETLFAHSDHGAQISSISWNLPKNIITVGGKKNRNIDNEDTSIRSYIFNPTDTVLEEPVKANHGDDIYQSVWDPSGNYLFVAGKCSMVAAGVLATNQLFQFDDSAMTLTECPGGRGNHLYPIYTAAWRPDGNYVAIGGERNQDPCTHRIYQFDSTQKTLTELPLCSLDHTNRIFTLDWSPDGKFLLVGGWCVDNGTHTTRLYEFDDIGQTLIEYESAEINFVYPTLSVAWRPDGNYLAMSGWRNNAITGDKFITTNIYSFDTTTTTFSLLTDCSVDHGQMVVSCAWTPDGQYLSTKGIGYNDISIRTYKFNDTAKTLTELKGCRLYMAGGLGQLHWRNDGQHLMVGGARVGGKSHKIFKFDPESESLSECPFTFSDLGDRVQCTAWRPDGNYCAVAGVVNSTYGSRITHQVQKFNLSYPTLNEITGMRIDSSRII